MNISSTGPSAQDDPTEVRRSFPLGVFEDGNLLVDPDGFAAMLDDLAAHELDSVYFVNTAAADADSYLAVADARRFNVVWAATELNRLWWSASVPATIERSREVVYAVVEQINGDGHPSLLGYHLVDEPNLAQAEKATLAASAFRERDPFRPSLPILIGLDRGDRLLAALKPEVVLIDVYPLAAANGPCEFAMRGFGYPGIDFPEYVRRLTRVKPAETPLWMILQTHRFGDLDNPAALREPSVAEVRAQFWMAIGEGATGIFWFIYSSQQDWIGLADNPTLFDEVADLARRVKPLQSTLLDLHHVPSRFAVTGGPNPYVATLADRESGDLYAVVVNRSCTQTHDLVVTAEGVTAWLEELESGRAYRLGESISVPPGDGKILRLIEVTDGDGELNGDPDHGVLRASRPISRRTARIRVRPRRSIAPNENVSGTHHRSSSC